MILAIDLGSNGLQLPDLKQVVHDRVALVRWSHGRRRVHRAFLANVRVREGMVVTYVCSVTRGS